MREERVMGFASASVPRHLVRGALGLVAFVAALALLGPVGAPALGLLVVAGIAWRGCPTCWMVGLQQTRERCDSGRCARI